MIRRYGWWVAIGLTALAALASVVLYPSMPEQVPIHWNIRGEIDGYGAKSWALFLCPGLMALLIGMFAILPWLSPKHFEVTTFRSTYLWLMILLTVLVGYIHALTLLAGLGWHFPMDRVLVGGMFLFFAMLGNVLGKVRCNFWVGIRVPWTLASERVWNDTHRLAAWLWVAGGLLGGVLALAGWPLVSMGVLVVIVVVPIVYSLIHYKRLERRGEVGNG